MPMSGSIRPRCCVLAMAAGVRQIAFIMAVHETLQSQPLAVVALYLPVTCMPCTIRAMIAVREG
jgi:hypothetical protein